MAKFIKTIRNNWKKSVFFCGLTVYGVYYGKHKYEDSILRTLYCTEAKKYGDLPLKTGERARRLTVFLNPAAHSGQSKKLFEENVAPILNLAGCEVTVVKTEYEGQVKKYMEVLENTDGIIVAGGDGTLLEVVTGLLRRPDQESASKIPIGVLPLGKTNRFVKKFFANQTDKSEAWWLLENAMAVVKNVTRCVDVMHIKGGQDKTVYAVSGIDWGYFRDVHLQKKDYWYFGPLKDKWAYLRASVGVWPPTVRAKITYSDPCEGCSRCVANPQPTPWKWWHFFMPPKQEVQKVDYSNVVNDNCGNQQSREVTSLEIACSCNDKTAEGKKEPLLISIAKEGLSKYEFIREGFFRVDKVKGDCCEIIPTSNFVMEPHLNQSEESWFSIDSEDFETMPIDVRLLKNKLHVFCPPSVAS